MEYKMRRTDRLIPEDEAKEILTRGEYGVLSLSSEDGKPYGIPLSYCYYEDAVYFHSAKMGRKLDVIEDNAYGSFCVVGKTEVMPEKFGTKYESVIVCGKIVEVLGEEKFNAMMAMLKKYSAEFFNEGVKYFEKDKGKTRAFKVVIESISGKAKR